MDNCAPPYALGYPFSGYNLSTPVIPQLYWDVDSAEQRWKEICCTLYKLIDYADSINIDLGLTKERVTTLENQFKKFMESGFFDYYAAQIEKWIKDNIGWLWRTFASQVFFGLTPDGYFCAYVPDSWQEITFDTGAVYGTYTYGRLILRFDADGNHVIDNTGYGAGGDADLLRSLQLQIEQLQKTVYTALKSKE